MKAKSLLFLFLIFLVINAFTCPAKMDKKVLAKIEFDYSALDEKGLFNGERALDYEFCIPSDESHRQSILTIAPSARFMEKSKGRIGCREGQWLCIVSTYDPKWKIRLYEIARLAYVDRIIETHYE